MEKKFAPFKGNWQYRVGFSATKEAWERKIACGNKNKKEEAMQKLAISEKANSR